MVALALLPWLALSGGEPHPSDLAARHLRDMLQRAHEARDGARLVARKLSVESALLPAFIVQDLAHGCASRDLARSLGYTYGGTDPALGAGTWWGPMSLARAPFEPGWTCPSGMAWRVRATTERLRPAGPEPAVAIDWIIESDGQSTTAIAERFEPALMPAELDFPLLPWDLVLQWDRSGGLARDRSGRSHAESWIPSAPILANPDDLYDTFDAVRVQQWLSRWRFPVPWIDPRPCAPPRRSHDHIQLDHGPLRWDDPTAYTLTRHGSMGDVAERFQPTRLIPAITGLGAVVEWCAMPAPLGSSSGTVPDHAPTRVPHRIRIIGDGREQAVVTFGRFELVRQGESIGRDVHEPPWTALRQAVDGRDTIAFTNLVLRAQDGLGNLRARSRMGVELALQALDAAIEAGWSIELLRGVAPELLERCLSRLTPGELTWLTLDATAASRATIALLCALRLLHHAGATAEERAWASQALPSLWAWLHEPPTDDSPLFMRRLTCDRALRPILVGERLASPDLVEHRP